MRLFGVGDLVAVVVVGHVGGDIRLIMAERTRFGSAIVRGEMVPVIRRLPSYVCRFVERIIDGRGLDEDRLDDICGTINIRLTYNLAIGSVVAHLHNYSGKVLEDIETQNRLQHKHMVVAVDDLHDADIIHIAVAIEVEVGNHVAR